MKQSRHSEEKIIAAVGQMEGGRKTVEVARERAAIPPSPVLVMGVRKAKGQLPEAVVQQILKETWQGQEADGGWTLKSLGPWMDHPQAPPQTRI